ncbi:hypothetical protein FRC09_020916 [Ceratobasidium sp. 395]|nr:hypothetical protein FRC09_020916 [Ceratobasidium sp. 395]
MSQYHASHRSFTSSRPGNRDRLHLERYVRPPSDTLGQLAMQPSLPAHMADFSHRPAFIDCWTISGHQTSHIAALEGSPSGKWILAASEDYTVLFIEFLTGWVVAKLTLDNPIGRFAILCGTWCSDAIALVGGSNGMMYIMEFQPHNDKHPISLRELLSPMPDQIKCIVLDSSQSYLAVAYGTQVAIYQRAAGAGFDSWTLIDRIAKPCEGEPALVHAVVFFGPMPCSLLVGYAEAGIVRSLALSRDECFIAIATLDQSVVTYPMSHDGPCIEEMHEYEHSERAPRSPTLPIVLTSSNLLISGTAVGDIPVLYPNVAPAFSLHQGKHHIIRAITTHSNLIAAASTGPNGIMIKCFMTQTQGEGAMNWSRGPQPPTLRVSLRDAIAAGEIGHVASTAVRPVNADPTVSTDPAVNTEPTVSTAITRPDETKTATTAKRFFILLKETGCHVIARCRSLNPDTARLLKYYSMGVGFIAVAVMLAGTPPGKKNFWTLQQPSSETRILKPELDPNEMVVLYRIRIYGKYVAYQFGGWFDWLFGSSVGCVSLIWKLPGAIWKLIMFILAQIVCGSFAKELGLCLPMFKM